MADDIEQVTAKMPPGQRSKVQEAVNEYVQAKTAKARQALAQRRERAMMGQYQGVQGLVVSTVGGGLAEVNRRKLVGRFTTGTRGQAAGLLVSGFGAQYLGAAMDLPYLGAVANSHAALAGFVLSCEMYDTKDKDDLVKVALEKTTHKAIHANDPKDE